ncbi:MAG: hypothetical protein JXR94_18705, partial [Candidatus Hydrogenedentes bacterium]|nr:hypothetical protein [Candidatus Hydrogenedentota bacterium]
MMSGHSESIRERGAKRYGWGRALSHLVLLSLALGLTLSLVEFEALVGEAMATRSVWPYWVGPAGAIWGAFFVGAAVYASVVFALSLGVYAAAAVLQRLVLKRRVSLKAGAATACVCALAASQGIWFVVSAH